MKVILASTSTIRSAVLSNAGVQHIVIQPAVDENALKTKYENPAPLRLSQALARDKALSISVEHRNDLVIGGDQVLVCDGRQFNKPISIEDARSQLQQLRGKPHNLISSLSVCTDHQQVWSATDTATLWMREFSDKYLSEYLDIAGPDVTTSVGGYKLEGRGIQLFDKVDGDHYTILGLPLLPLLAYLRSTGVIAA